MGLNIPDSSLPRVIVIGGGFGGVSFVNHISSKDFQTVLIDKQNYHGFQPLLYQVATAGLEPDSIAYPLRKFIDSKPNVYFRMAQVESVNADSNTISTDHGELTYDYLVIATGAKSNFFGNSSLEEHALPMKSIPEALEIRSVILERFETASREPDAEIRKGLMSFVVVGGGPTGTELAGALAELRSHVLPGDYPELKMDEMHIDLIEGSDRLLAAMKPRASQKAMADLIKLGVRVHLNTFVKAADSEGLETADGSRFTTRNIIWAAGVQANPIKGLPEKAYLRNGRLQTDEANFVTGTKNVFAIGDVSANTAVNDGRGDPMLAQPAIQQGKLLTKNLKRLQKGIETKPFVYNDKGSMATIGRNKAVADIAGTTITGIFAWLIWMFVHLMALAGYRNRAVTLANWAYNYLKYDNGNRLIIRKSRRSLSK